MSFINEKWKSSSILTKVALYPMLLATLLLLICAFVFMSWQSAAIKAGASVETASVFTVYWVLFLILFLYNGLLSIGLFKVNNIARVLTILLGLGSVIAVLFLIGGIGITMQYAREMAGDETIDAAKSALNASKGIYATIFKAILQMLPTSILTKIGFYIFIFTATPFLQVFSMLILFFCGKDFKRKVTA
jgi:hypothetical protein